jgi:hypothetical protein
MLFTYILFLINVGVVGYLGSTLFVRIIYRNINCDRGQVDHKQNEIYLMNIFLSKGKIRNIIFKISKATFRKMATTSHQKNFNCY